MTGPGRWRRLVAAPCGDAQLSRGALCPAGGGGRAGAGAASSVMVSDMVDNGLLVAYRPEVRVPGAAYSVLCAPGRERHPPVRAFLAWLQQELPQGNGTK